MKGENYAYTLTVSYVRCITMLTSVVHAEQSSAIHLTENSALENTQQNVRDKDNITLTAEDQNESKADIKITADIRNAAVNDESLSVNAKNVKIITQNGAVKWTPKS
ncbi:hypothetical protein A1359_11570, partial [Methylomonas lenta]